MSQKRRARPFEWPSLTLPIRKESLSATGLPFCLTSVYLPPTSFTITGVHVPTVVVASSLARWLTPSPTAGAGERSFEVAGTTVREVLEALFARYPQLRGYVTDERGALRHHVVAFVNGVAVQDKTALSEAVPPNGEVHIFQALSGGET